MWQLVPIKCHADAAKTIIRTQYVPAYVVGIWATHPALRNGSWKQKDLQPWDGRDAPRRDEDFASLDTWAVTHLPSGHAFPITALHSNEIPTSREFGMAAVQALHEHRPDATFEYIAAHGARLVRLLQDLAFGVRDMER